MPATRRTRTHSGPAAKGSQRTISFGTKVTKPNTSTPSSKISKPALPIPPPSKEEEVTTTTTDVGRITPEAAISQQAETEVTNLKAGDGREKTEAEGRAGKVTDAQIKRYWKAREAERKTGRVHQKELDVEEKILRLFDMSSQYGPCIGIARMQRWARADKLGLEPPIEVLAVLLREQKRGNGKIERAHVDELMSSKFVIEEA